MQPRSASVTLAAAPAVHAPSLVLLLFHSCCSQQPSQKALVFELTCCAHKNSVTHPHPLQAFTLIIWAAGRFFLYSSYFAIFGALFGFKNFGRMVAIDNTFNGLIGILQLPLAWWGVGGLHGNFTLINCLQARASLRVIFGMCSFGGLPLSYGLGSLLLSLKALATC